MLTYADAPRRIQRVYLCIIYTGGVSSVSDTCIRQHMSAYVISDTCCPVSRAHYIYTCVLYIQKKGTEGILMLYIQVAYAAYVSCMLTYAEICICEHTSAYRTLTLLTHPVCKIHRRHLLCREHYIYLLYVCIYKAEQSALCIPTMFMYIYVYIM